jgi:hypothetical protein
MTRSAWSVSGSMGVFGLAANFVRNFPPGLVEQPSRLLVVRDGQALAYIYYEDEPGRRSAIPLCFNADF